MRCQIWEKKKLRKWFTRDLPILKDDTIINKWATVHEIKGRNKKIDPNLENLYFGSDVWKGDTCLTPAKIDYMCPLTSIFVKSIFCCYIMPPNGLCPFRRLSLLICKCYWLNWHADDGMSSWFVKYFYDWCSIFLDNTITSKIICYSNIVVFMHNVP